MSLALVACAGPQASYGPLPVRNQHPAQTTVLHLDPVPAAPLRAGAVAGRVAAAYSSLFLAGNGTGAGSGNAFVMDGETLRTDLQVRIGLGSRLELDATLPFLHTSGGFLDSFLIDYHALFGFPSQGRDVAPKNVFQVHADYQGQRVFEVRSEALRVADTPISLTWGLAAPTASAPGVALRFGTELPTGNDDRGIGNGRFDYACGLVASWPLSWSTLHAAVQHTFAGTPARARAAGLEFRDVTSASATLELPLFEDLSALVQAELEDSTLRQLDFARASAPQLLVWLGGRLRLDRDLFVEIAFGEDAIGFVSPDFTAWLGMAWLPGAAATRRN